MTLRFVTALRNAQIDAIRDQIDAGGGAATITIYDGSQPATGGSGTTVLAELVMSFPSSGNAASGAATYDAVNEDPAANAGGTATWFRIKDSLGAFVMDGTVTATGGGGDMQLITTTIVVGQPVEITSFVMTNGNP